MGRILRSRRGSAVVEFTLVGTLLLLLLFAVVDLGLLLNARLCLTQAARAGARQAIVDGGASDRTYAVIREQLALCGLADGTWAAVTPRRASYGTLIRVALAHDYRFRTPLTRTLGGRAVRLQVTLLARSEKLTAGEPR